MSVRKTLHETADEFGVDTISAVLDREAILDRIGGDASFLAEIAGVFIEDCPRLLGEIRAAIAAGDARGLEHAAHALKGSVANFGAEPAREAAFRLEVLGRMERLDEAPAVCGVLESELNRFTQALAALALQLNPK